MKRRPAQRAPDPHVLVDMPTRRDRSGGGAPLVEHVVQITVAAREPAFARVGAIEQALLDRLAVAPTLVGHRLVLLDLDHAEFRRDADRRGARARLTLRALTEPL